LLNITVSNHGPLLKEESSFVRSYSKYLHAHTCIYSTQEGRKEGRKEGIKKLYYKSWTRLQSLPHFI